LFVAAQKSGMASRKKVLLVAGATGSGKTSLIRRFADGAFSPDQAPTIGLDESAASVLIQLDRADLTDEAAALLPADGLELDFWEIGGKGGHREAPRGKTIDGILLCYDVGERASFQQAAHILLQYRMDRHLAHERSVVVAKGGACGGGSPARLAAVLVGTKSDEYPCDVRSEEARDFAQANAIHASVVTSARTGDGVAQAVYSLMCAALEAEEDAEAELAVAKASPLGPCPNDVWSLKDTKSSSGTMTAPRGLRHNEPPRGAPAQRLCEVFDTFGSVYAARPLGTCLEKGLLHRAVHVWICDLRTGGLLLRKYSPRTAKHPGKWGPSCHGEVLSYGAEGDSPSILNGPHASELSTHAAARILGEQIGIDKDSPDWFRCNPEHWFSVTSRDGNCNELIDVYVSSQAGGGLPPLRLLPCEEVEWVHFADVFGKDAVQAGTIFFMEKAYRGSMVERMQARIVHTDMNTPGPPTGLAQSRPACALPITASVRA